VGGLFGEWKKISDEDNASSGRYLPDFWPPQLAAFCFLRLHRHLKSVFDGASRHVPSFRLIEPFGRSLGTISFGAHIWHLGFVSWEYLLKSIVSALTGAAR
jgi:hypothetical protein